MISIITIFFLSCFVGYYVILKVTPALHAPLMSVTNAISSIIIIVGLKIILDSSSNTLNFWLGISGVFLAAVNIFGGFFITNRMLVMFSKR